MGLTKLLKKLTTSKPKLEHPEPIEGTDLIEGSGDVGIVIYDSKTNRTLFGGANPDLWYIGRLNGTHIARKQEQIDGKWKTYFVDERGNILFGKKYDSESLVLADSNSDEYVDINLHRLDSVSQRDRLKGSENTLVEYVQDGFDKGILNVYDKSGRSLATSIPAFIEETKKDDFLSGDYQEMCPATRLCFVGIDGQLFLDVKYGQKSEAYKLNWIQETPAH